MWAARYINIRDDMHFSLSGTLATMANGLPYSIGAAVAYPNRQVVCIVGDGGFTTQVQGGVVHGGEFCSVATP